VSSAQRYALMHELRGAPELSLPDAIGLLAPCALVLVEGYKTHPLPKLEIWRPAVGKPLLHPRDPRVLAVATDVPAALAECPLPVFGLDQADEIATFVLAHAVVLPPGIDAPGRSE
jgi:molybdopterin-guanine dinucleotide biosynthesis adapter protein